MTPPRKTKRKRKLNIFRAFILLVLVLSIIAIGAAAGLAVGVMRAMPDWQPGDLKLAMTTFIYDKEGQLVEELHGEQNRVVVPLDKVPESLQKAVIAIEDERFEQHHGIDLKAILRAFFTNLRSGDIREGGSTITQQLAKNAFIENPMAKTYKRKIQEAMMAIELERTYTKKEILENYLNIVYLGPGIYGVEAASHYYFGKPVSELDLAESAMLAGIIQSPATYSPPSENNLPAAKKRRDQVLNNMLKLGYINAEQAEKAKAQEPEFHQASITKKAKYPYFIDTVIDEASALLEKQGISPSQLYQGGLRIYTTLDTRVQTEMEKIYQDDNNFPASASDRLIESAMVVLDHRTGEIQGIIGGRNYTTRRGFNYATQAKRQPGSTIKPLVVYGPALEQNFSPAYVLDDAPVSFPSTPKPFTPTNYDRRYRGLVTMREAIRWSINIPAVKMLHTIGIDSGFEFGRRLGLPLQPSDQNLSLALGGLTTGVSPLEMTAAYGAFANQGVYIEPHVITKITDRNDKELVVVQPTKQAVMSEQIAYLMTDMLTTVVSSGTATNARLNRPAAGKTGTTSLPDLPGFAGKTGSRDAWYVGYTPELVATVWMGYDPTDPDHYLRNVAGGGHPALIWKKVINVALKDQPVRAFPRPSGIIYADVDAKSGLLPSDLTPNEFIIKEIFIQNMLPKNISEAWVEAQICSDSGQLPTPACLNLTTGVFLDRPTVTSANVEDMKLAIPRETCTLHTDDSSGLVAICIDPRHEGVPHLANIPGLGQSGGCPPEYIRRVNLPPGEIPARNCDLAEHQLRKNAGELENNDHTSKTPSLKGKLQVDASLSNPQINLTWNSTGNGNILYSVERRQDGSSYKSIAMVKETSYTDTAVGPGSAYRYRIVALDQSDNSSYPSNEVTITIPQR